MENITKEQADIIGEVANICTGTAATALSMIINRSIHKRLRRDKSYGTGCSGCAGHCKSYDGR